MVPFSPSEEKSRTIMEAAMTPRSGYDIGIGAETFSSPHGGQASGVGVGADLRVAACVGANMPAAAATGVGVDVTIGFGVDEAVGTGRRVGTGVGVGVTLRVSGEAPSGASRVPLVVGDLLLLSQGPGTLPGVGVGTQRTVTFDSVTGEVRAPSIVAMAAMNAVCPGGIKKWPSSRSRNE